MRIRLYERKNKIGVYRFPVEGYDSPITNTELKEPDNGKKWNPKDEIQLTTLYELGKTNKEIGKIMERTTGAIRVRLYRRKIKIGSYKNPVEGYDVIESIEEHFNKKSIQENIEKEEVNIPKQDKTKRKPKVLKKSDSEEMVNINLIDEIISNGDLSTVLKERSFTYTAYKDICMMLNKSAETKNGKINKRSNLKHISKDDLLELLKKKRNTLAPMERNNVQIYLKNNNINLYKE